MAPDCAGIIGEDSSEELKPIQKHGAQLWALQNYVAGTAQSDQALREAEAKVKALRDNRFKREDVRHRKRGHAPARKDCKVCNEANMNAKSSVRTSDAVL